MVSGGPDPGVLTTRGLSALRKRAMAGSTGRSGLPGGGPGADTAAEGSLTFPDLSRLELDQLLEQLVERAQKVLASQGRLRRL